MAADRWEVTGSAGAIPQRVLDPDIRDVRVIATEWRSEQCVGIAPDGSFRAELEAGPGMTLLIVPVVSEGCSGFAQTAAGALVMRTAEGVIRGDEFAFATSAMIDGVRWIGTGALSGAEPRLTFRLKDAAPTRCLVPRLHIHRLFDGEGAFVSHVNSAVHGPVLTPTGLPIETSDGPYGYWARFDPAGDACLRDSLVVSLAGWDVGLPPGWYRPRVVFYDRGLGGDLPARDLSRPPPETAAFADVSGTGYLPLIPTSEVSAPILPASFLNGDPSWGAAGIRGVQAEEDRGRFALASRRAAQAPFIASPHDPLTGAERTYLFEPFLPTVAYTGFGEMYQQTPILSFAREDTGTVSIALRTPSGREQVLAKDAPVRGAFMSGGINSSTVPISFAGPNRTFGLVTGEPTLEVAFEEYGRHTLTLAGSLKTAWGQEVALRGTYEIWVAEPLQLSLGTLQGTPLEVGEQYSPVISVRPGVPAEVEVTIDHYVDGDADKKRTYHSGGRANPLGYYVAQERWRPDAHGEYIARVVARYVDPVDNVLWMASRTGASIVATPEASLIAHGVRNTRLADIRQDGTERTWFFNRALDPACGEATCESAGRTEARSLDYPYHRGDVAWLADVAPLWPAITLEDPGRVLAPSGFVVPAPDETVPVLPYGGNRPGEIDRWMYWYSSTVRPDDISVFHAASDGTRADHQQWYGNDTYNCQIGLTCYSLWDDFPHREDRAGDEEGDLKVMFGGMVVKGGSFRAFVPYAAMAVIIPETVQEEGQRFRFRDEKGQRICPPYQGAAGGLATCGPLLNVGGLPFDLFVTPTGTRPGSTLTPGDRFVFSGLVWPTLDVAYEVTVREPSGASRSFTGRASRVGYIDGKGAEFVVGEPGVYEVHISLVQDQVVPSTGLAPSPALVADGRTVQPEHGYSRPLSAILGSAASTYHFYVGSSEVTAQVRTDIGVRESPHEGARVPTSVDITTRLGGPAKEIHYTLAIPGLVIRSGSVKDTTELAVSLSEATLYKDGYTSIVLGADSLELTVAANIGDRWSVKRFDLRGVTPFGGQPVTFR